ncbi:NAD-dependent epimerase/dehydratase family protein [Jeotgalibaca arthritidis]|uniref:NAD-dependent epimerase/dehydratase family protein n=1 Tax=Jeotgalibaca arthritidis TaxID=1868794 RepID=A0A6G7KB03_9LACT|nr:NAD-dependent epimerase/dehydratase family protein [Jeotgalibaca arthritidis]
MTVIGLDNLNDYYDPALKDERLKTLLPEEKFTFIKGDISDKDFIMSLFETEKFDVVVNLAAQVLTSSRNRHLGMRTKS